MDRDMEGSCVNEVELKQSYPDRSQSEDPLKGRQNNTIELRRDAEGNPYPPPCPRLQESRSSNREASHSDESPKSPPKTVYKPSDSTQSQLRPSERSSTIQVAHKNQQSGENRQQRGSEKGQSPVDIPPPEPYWRRSKKPFQSEEEAVRAYWDTLSKVWPTKSALKEFDRRTTQLIAPLRPTSRGLSGKKHSNQIKHFARRGGPDLSNLRGYPEPKTSNSSALAMAPNSPIAGAQDDKNPRSDTTYDLNFEKKLIDGHVYPHGHAPGRGVKPNNLDGIKQRLAQRRPSLSSPSDIDTKFKAFKALNKLSRGQTTVTSDVFSTIAGDSKILSQRNISFSNLEALTDGTLADSKPDIFDGVYRFQLDKRVLANLEKYIVPSKRLNCPCLPNFFVEEKGTSGSNVVNNRQATYDGALGVRAMHKLQSFGTEDTYDNNAYTISAVYHAELGILALQAHHLTQPTAPRGEPDYHATLIDASCLILSAESFQQGACKLRNAREWAKEQRDHFVAVANERASNMPPP